MLGGYGEAMKIDSARTGIRTSDLVANCPTRCATALTCFYNVFQFKYIAEDLAKRRPESRRPSSDGARMDTKPTAHYCVFVCFETFSNLNSVRLCKKQNVTIITDITVAFTISHDATQHLFVIYHL
ncbi:hypothetical protein PoB_004940000 [Plakobranchus ocellatus]|uniref:Uncharacterized protein n=1 Tax=Plakobranchus ocellatus TaxID=259542 RepID=A0AAV4BUB1_9GAST|nr:hypothetical protein PoB_004940000 [Plakobranchus ocellatus]